MFVLMVQDNIRDFDRNGLFWDGEWIYVLVVVVVFYIFFGVYLFVGCLVVLLIFMDVFYIVVFFYRLYKYFLY